MGEWGMSMADAVALPERHAMRLLRAYAGRKRFEARILIGQLAEAMQPKRETGNLAGLSALGFGIRGA